MSLGPTNPMMVLIGGGRMGSALIAGWLRSGVGSDRICVVEPDDERRRFLEATFGIRALGHPGDWPAGDAVDLIVIAVKPAMVDGVLPECRQIFGTAGVYLSIAAGRTLASIQEKLGKEAAVVRSMPNTPAAAGKGMTVACANPRVSAEQKDLCTAALAAVGEVAWVDDERLLDPVTAVSGSGPAYVFLLAETLCEAGIAAGLPAELAARLARATIIGAGELLAGSDQTPAALREMVTSPGGTTAAALSVLMASPGMSGLMTEAVAAATRRSQELSAPTR